MAHGQINQPKPGQGVPSSPLPDPTKQPPASAQTTPTTPADPANDAPIVPDATFEKEVPQLSSDPTAPLEPIEEFTAPAPVVAQPTTPGQQPGAGTTAADAAAAQVVQDSELNQPLPPLSSFNVEPVQIAGVEDAPASEIRYETRVEGLEEIGLTDRFNALSALKNDKDAPNAVIVAARAREDEELAKRLMRAIGYYDGTATSSIEPLPGQQGRVRAVLTAIPGVQYKLGSITVRADPTVPPGMIERELPLKVGEAVDAERIQGAEANVSLRLPQQGYAFAQVGQRDILLDDATHLGDYTLPVALGPRGSFGRIVSKGDPVFETDHIEILRRYKPGELYDARRVDDLRQALVATSLFSSVAVEPQRTGRAGPDGTEEVDLLVTQNKGPARTLAGQVGYGTGEGFTLQGSWTHRNLFPPEGALIVSGIAGTQQQGLGVTFRRSNAGKRDRTVTLVASANRQDYDAFEAFTGTLSGRISYDSTPIWQKKWTYFYGVELVGTNEDVYDFTLQDRVRRTYLIGALPGYLGYDSSDDLLNPTRGFRVKLNLSPEASMNRGTRPYVRGMLEGTAYYPVTSSIVIAGRARIGAIAGISRDDLAPSRRYYAGGGGSVRGFGFQELGPKTEEPNPKFDPNDPDSKEPPTIFRPVGGRSFNEFAIEARYRFGNFGIVPFLDAGQVYDSTLPKGSDLRFGAGIGGRFYTNFGPMRIDVATPIARKPGESKIALYLSIGQAF
ncbi:BamA/TamA family outer membrane protein [uncultured Sphingomonas sp.]|uniref:BamA/TamA family outer membrane protein n=1 Tax=uncultured Sphingomonas sp. TaxID=158754 RepID=UPI0025F4BD62|nr:BamA/TamA family outer membrane protein [uncultured Sphingomonas sp.]